MVNHNVKLEDGNLVYRDAEGKSLYAVNEEMRGYTIPHSNYKDTGGSTAFDPNLPIPVIVNPDHPEFRSVRMPPEQPSTTPAAVPTDKTASAQPEEIATLGSAVPDGGVQEDVTVFKDVEDKKSYVTSYPDTPDLHTPRSPVIDVMEPDHSNPQPVCPVPDPEVEAYVRNRSQVSGTKVLYNLGADIGSIECLYKRVFKDGIILVLVREKEYHGSKYNPPLSLTRDGSIVITVGKDEDTFNVIIGPYFTDDSKGEEYQLLFISE